jgi:hypothetical protein
MMPFLPELDWLHQEIVAAGCDVKARVWRADDIFEAGIIIEQIRNDRGRRFLLAIPGWYGWERERAADENEYQSGQTQA